MSDTNKRVTEVIDEAQEEGGKPLSDVEFLACSSNRWNILKLLCDSPQGHTEIKSKLEVPRTTLRRNLVELEKKGWINEVTTENRYRISSAGKFVCENFAGLLEVFQQANQISFFLNYMSDPSLLPSIELLKECDFTLATGGEPYAPMYRFISLLETTSAQSFRGFSPAFNPLYLDPVSTAVEKEIRFEFVGNEQFYTSAKQQYPEDLRALNEADHTELRQSEEIPEIGVGIIGETVIVGVYDEMVRTQAILEANSQDMLEWAKQVYETKKEDSRRYS